MSYALVHKYPTLRTTEEKKNVHFSTFNGIPPSAPTSLLFEEQTLHFYFAWNPADCVAIPLTFNSTISLL